MTRKTLALACVLLLVVSATAWAVLFTNTLLGATPTAVQTFAVLGSGARTTASTAVYDARFGQTGNGYTKAMIECIATFPSAAPPGTSLDVYLLKSHDGTNYEDALTTRTPDAVCPATLATTTRVSVMVLLLPVRYKVAVQNSGSGLTTTASTAGNTVNLLPFTQQGL